AARAERREPLEAPAERLDALCRVVRAAQQRQRQYRRKQGYRGGGLEAARLERLERLGVAAVRDLRLPDADAVEPCRRVPAKVVDEARPDRRDLRDRDARLHAPDLLMTFDI